MRNRVAIIGSVGVPNRYGGPEAFTESIAPKLLEAGFEMAVTCDRSRYLDDLSRVWRGVRRVFIPVRANGALSPLHDFLAFLAVVVWADVVLVLGVSGGLFFPVMRLMCSMCRTRLLVNIDGIEWRRSKFSLAGRSVLLVSDFLAQVFAHVVVYDNEGLLPFVRTKSKAVCVEYSGDQAVEAGHQARPVAGDTPFALTICRIEPENNCEVLIRGFLSSSRPRYVFVGNWDRSVYGRELRMKYARESRLELRDPVYDPAELFRLRTACSEYLHGHSVGGTNPSLVEIIFFDCRIHCFDCVFNRCTAGDTAVYFRSAEELAQHLDDPSPERSERAAVRSRYTRSAIASKLIPTLNG